MTPDQITTMIRLRCDEELTQREIAAVLGVTHYVIKNHWHYVPKGFQKHLTYNDPRQKASKRIVPKEKHAEFTGGQCPCCGFAYTTDNPRMEGGWCFLCEYQAAGKVVLYDEIANS